MLVRAVSAFVTRSLKSAVADHIPASSLEEAVFLHKNYSSSTLQPVVIFRRSKRLDKKLIEIIFLSWVLAHVIIFPWTVIALATGIPLLVILGLVETIGLHAMVLYGIYCLCTNSDTEKYYQTYRTVFDFSLAGTAVNFFTNSKS